MYNSDNPFMHLNLLRTKEARQLYDNVKAQVISQVSLKKPGLSYQGVKQTPETMA